MKYLEKHNSNNQVSLELLDSPGIIPSNMIDDQESALLLAACNCIGDASYDNQHVASYLLQYIQTLHVMKHDLLMAPHWRQKVKQKYGFDPLSPVSMNIFASQIGKKDNSLYNGDELLHMTAQNVSCGDYESAARRILQDFRSGRMGPIVLQLAEDYENQEHDQNHETRESSTTNSLNCLKSDRSEEKIISYKTSIHYIKSKGYELPSFLQDENNSATKSKENKLSTFYNPRNIHDKTCRKKESEKVEKGIFDKW